MKLCSYTVKVLLPMNLPVKKYLITILRFHGDVLLVTPIIGAIKKNFPEAQIDLLVYKGTGDILKFDSRLQDIIEIEPTPKINIFSKIKRELMLWRTLKKNNYNYALFLTTQWRLTFIGRIMNDTFSAAVSDKKREHSFWRNSFSTLFPEAGVNHIIERNLQALGALGIETIESDKKLSLTIGVEVMNSISKLLESLVVTKSITLSCEASCIIDARGISGSAVVIDATGATLDGFTIVGDETMYAGVVVTPTCVSVTVSNNTISGMTLSNPGNDSPLSYGILAYGNSSSEMPIGSTFSGNDIFYVSGAAISLGSYTYGTTITGNYLHDIIPVEVLGEQLSVGVQSEFAGDLNVSGNTFGNLFIGTSLLASEGSVSGNTYNNVASLHTSTYPSYNHFEYSPNVSDSGLCISDMDFIPISSYIL